MINVNSYSLVLAPVAPFILLQGVVGIVFLVFLLLQISKDPKYSNIKSLLIFYIVAAAVTGCLTGSYYGIVISNYLMKHPGASASEAAAIVISPWINMFVQFFLSILHICFCYSLLKIRGWLDGKNKFAFWIMILTSCFYSFVIVGYIFGDIIKEKLIGKK